MIAMLDGGSAHKLFYTYLPIQFNMEDISIEWAFMIRREVDRNLLSFTCIVGIHYIHLHALKAR